MNIYISYSRKDSEHANRICHFLRDEGISVFLDTNNIPAGENWERAIQNKIPSSDTVILLWSRWAAKSVHVMRELTQALSAKRKIIPCMIDKEKLSPLIENIQYLKWSESSESKKQLLEAIGIKLNDDDVNTSHNHAISNYLKKLLDRYSYLKVFGKAKKYSIESLYMPLKISIGNKSGKQLQFFTADELLSSELKNIVILGLPGAGKSTLLKYLVHIIINKDYQLFPVLLKISSLMETGDNILEFISQNINGIIGRKQGKIIASHDNFCRQGTVILFDGYDEIMQNDQKEFKKKLMSFQNAHPDCTIIITSRFSSFSPIDHYKECTLSKLSENDIEEYISNVCDIEKKKQVWNMLKNDSRILELAQTPFLLSMITASYEGLEERATQRATLFELCTKYLLRGKNWDDDFVDNPKYENKDVSETLINALKLIAVRFFKLDSQSEFQEEEILFIIRSLENNQLNLDSRDILARICKYSGLLQKTGSSYYFIHRSIWEYFVAQGMKDEPIKNLLTKANIPIWEEPIRLYIGLSVEREIEDFVSELWKRNKGLTLRAMTELQIFPDKLLSKMIAPLDAFERLRVLQQLKDNIKNNQSKIDSKRLILDTVGTLLKVENDCQVIYECIQLLQHYYSLWGFDEFNDLVVKKLDLNNADKRLKNYTKSNEYYTEFVCVPNGSFIMGTNDEQRTLGERPEHNVELDSFCISKFPVINKLFYDSFPFAKDKKDERSSLDAQPVIFITWYEAFIFAKWLGCDLPTEAEWEFACRSGGDDDSLFFDYNIIPEYAWYIENSENMTHEVGCKKPNSLGLYDMLGNVREWCKDWFHNNYYESCIDNGITTNPTGPPKGNQKVLKGGCFDWNIANLVPTYRNYNQPSNSYFVNGFRLVFRGNEDIIKKQ